MKSRLTNKNVQISGSFSANSRLPGEPALQTHSITHPGPTALAKSIWLVRTSVRNALGCLIFQRSCTLPLPPFRTTHNADTKVFDPAIWLIPGLPLPCHVEFRLVHLCLNLPLRMPTDNLHMAGERPKDTCASALQRSRLAGKSRRLTREWPPPSDPTNRNGIWLRVPNLEFKQDSNMRC